MSRLFLFLAVFVFTLIFLFFPIFLHTNAHYDLNKRKFGFSIHLYKWIKLLGGYIATYQGGLAVHLSQKKAILVPYAQLNNERKRFSFMRTFRLKSFVLTTETGAEYLLPIAVAHATLRTYFFIKGGKKENIENNLWLTDGDILRVSLHCVLFFNIYILLCSLFKFLKEKIKILWQKKMKKLTT